MQFHLIGSANDNDIFFIPQTSKKTLRLLSHPNETFTNPESKTQLSPRLLRTSYWDSDTGLSPLLNPKLHTDRHNIPNSPPMLSQVQI